MREIARDGFEHGFSWYTGISELEVPNGWAPDWVQGDGEPGVLVRFECKPKYQTPEVRSGNWSASIHTREATHQGVLFRQFEAENSKQHRASVWAMGVTGPKGECGHGMRIGIDPTGRLDFRADTVIWSDWYSQYMDEWEDRQWWKLSVEAVAENERVTVFLWSSNDYKKDAYAHFDDFLLEVEGDSPQPGGGECGFVDRTDEILTKLDALGSVLAVVLDRLDQKPNRSEFPGA